MKATNKAKRPKEKDTNKYLTCPRCEGIVPYERRGRHSCFRQHLMEVERDITQMSRSMRVS